MKRQSGIFYKVEKKGLRGSLQLGQQHTAYADMVLIQLKRDNYWDRVCNSDQQVAFVHPGFSKVFSMFREDKIQLKHIMLLLEDLVGSS